MHLLLPLSERKRWRIALAGKNRELSPLYRPHAKGEIKPGKELAHFLQGAKVNIHINGDTNFHARILECLGAGGFVLVKTHITDSQYGGLRSIADTKTASTRENFKRPCMILGHFLNFTLSLADMGLEDLY